jgi:hypothetical protein
MSNYNNYGSIAIAVSKEGRSPKEEWAKASKLFFDSKDSQDKNCPRSAFLGLCEQGLVKGIKRGIYLTNSEYALIAVKILTNNATFSRKELWEEVKEHLNISKSHNSQMDVVIALFENKMIVL